MQHVNDRQLTDSYLSASKLRKKRISLAKGN